MRITIEIDGKRFRAFTVAAILLGAIGAPFLALAGNVTLPHTFVNGQVADANDVNANFSALADAVNDLDSRVSALSSRVPPTFSANSNFAVFETPGVSQFVVPSGVTRVLIEAWGAGGGGVGAGGGFGKDFFNVVEGQTLSVGVGSGGVGNAGGGSTQVVLNGTVILLASGGGNFGGSGGGGGTSSARFNVTGSGADVNPTILGFASGGTIRQAPGGGSGTNGASGRVVIWY